MLVCSQTPQSRAGLLHPQGHPHPASGTSNGTALASYTAKQKGLGFEAIPAPRGAPSFTPVAGVRLGQTERARWHAVLLGLLIPSVLALVRHRGEETSRSAQRTEDSASPLLRLVSGFSTFTGNVWKHRCCAPVGDGERRLSSWWQRDVPGLVLDPAAPPPRRRCYSWPRITSTAAARLFT